MVSIVRLGRTGNSHVAGWNSTTGASKNADDFISWFTAYNPTYLYYTLGKLQIYKLREDYRRAKGAAFTLRGFHDEFVRQGGLPIKLIRRILLPGDTSPTL